MMDAWTKEHYRGVYARALRHEMRVPETGVLYLEELSGPDGAHFTLFFTREQYTPDNIRRTKSACRNHWDVTGFTLICIDRIEA